MGQVRQSVLHPNLLGIFHVLGTNIEGVGMIMVLVWGLFYEHVS